MATQITIDKIRFKRGLTVNMPTLYVGEPFFAEDTGNFWMGTNEGNINLSKNEEYTELVNIYQQFLQPTTLESLKNQTLDLNTFKLGYVDSKLVGVDEKVAEQDADIDALGIRIDAMESDLNDMFTSNQTIVAYMPAPSDILTNTQNFQKLADMALTKGVPIKIIFPDGWYEVNTMFIHSNTHVFMNKNTTLNFTAPKVFDPEAGYNKTVSSVFMNARVYHPDDSKFTGYNGNGNIIIEGGTTIGGCFFTFVHGYNIVVRNVNIKDMTSDHCFQINSSRNVLIDGVKIRGVMVQTTDRNYVETMQIDWCTYAGVPGWVSTAPLYDHTINNGVTIRNCDFGKSEDPAKLQNLYTCIGSHSSDGNLKNKNILIEHNKFADTTYANVSPRYMENVTIRNNEFGSTFVDGNLIHCDSTDNIRIYGNTFRDGRRAFYGLKSTNIHFYDNDVYGGYAFPFYTQEGAEGVFVHNNTFRKHVYGTSSATALIALRSAKRFFVYNNVSIGCSLSSKNSSNADQETAFVLIYAISGDTSNDGFIGRNFVDDYTKIKRETYVTYSNSVNVHTESYNGGLTWVSIGDSITAGNNSGNGYYQEYAVPLVKNVSKHINRGYSGYSFTRYSNPATGGTILDKTSEIERADLYTVFLGTNDWSRNAPVGSTADATGKVDSMWGAMKQLYVDLTTKNMNAQIIFITPMKRRSSPAWNTTNGTGVKMDVYVQAIKDFCAQYAIPLIDLYNISGVSDQTAGTLLYDGLHPNTMGNERIGRIIGRQINSII